jgi:hypothetical protein
VIFWRMPRFGPLILVAGTAVYFAAEHEQGKHEQAHLLCPICWLNRIAPATEPSDGTPTASQE